MSVLQAGDPRRLGPYELLERLGEGGQGVVYLGHGTDGVQVAIKLLRADLTEDDSARSRFVREVQAAKAVARFCTAQVIDADVAGDRPYIVSELVTGPSLQWQVEHEGPRSGATLERLAIGTATALVAIHQAGIVHRDFKPHNVLLGPDGPRVIDFGIARALDAGSTASTKSIGTPAYMAPEQVMGQPLTEAVDMFAWAATMVYASTGHPPFGQDTIPAVINRILNQEPSLEATPADLRDLIRECLAKEPIRRPSAQGVLMRLIGGTQPVEPPTRLEQREPTPMSTDELPTAVLAEGVNRAGMTRQMGAQPGGTIPGGPGNTYGLPPVPHHDPYARTIAPYSQARKKSPWPVVGVVVAVLAIALLAGGLALALSGSGDKNNDNAPTSVPTSQESSASEEPSEEQSSEPERTTEPTKKTPPPTKSTPPSSPPSSPPSTPPSTPPPSSSPPPSSGSGGGEGGGGDTGGGEGGTG